jgi:esterase/lipase superfamily enzyme
MRRDVVNLYSPAIGAGANVIALGSYGRPVLAFPAMRGRAHDWESTGMVDAVRPLIDAGRVKLYLVDSFDDGSWFRNDLPLDARAREHLKFEDWILNQVVPFIHQDCAGIPEIITTGCSMGAFHAVTFALRHAHVFPVALGLSGVYDVRTFEAWGDYGTDAYFVDPIAFVGGLHGDHLAWLQRQLTLHLVVGTGAWEDSSGALQSTRALRPILEAKGLRTKYYEWGWDTPHDWPSWRRQIATYLPEYC